MLEDQLILDDNRQQVSDEILLNHNFGSAYAVAKVDFKQHLKNLRYARNIMLVIAFLTLGVECYLLSQINWESSVLIFVVVELLILFGLYFLSFRYAALSFVLFLVFYLGIFILLVALGESNATDGMILRIIAVVLLIKGASSASQVERFRKKLTDAYLDQQKEGGIILGREL